MHTKRHPAATIGGILFGFLALSIGLGTVRMLGSAVFGAEENVTAVQIVFGLCTTLVLGWLARKCWKKKASASDAVAATQAKSLKPGKKEVADFYSKIYGTSHRNRDGTSRQSAIRKDCYPGAQLDLVREPNNKHDNNAIAVYYNDKQLGYLSADIASQYAGKLDQGAISLSACIEDITGGPDTKTYGANISIRVTYN